MSEELYSKGDPRYHTAQIRGWMQELIDHLREDVGKVDDPQAEALFETSAEVLGGLQKAFEHFEEKNEEAWQPS